MGWPNFSRECRREVDEVLKSGVLTAYRANLSWGSIGPRKDSQAWRLEREIEKKFKVRHAIVVNSGTAALHSALSALQLRRGFDVVTSPYTFSSTASAILHAGGTPVFSDVDPHTFCITKETVKRVITKRTAAILPVHLFGYFPDLSGLQSFGLPIIEDSCQAVGASRGGTGGGLVHQQFSGTVGLAGAYSFNGSKNLPAGEGGCLVTNSDEIAEKARRFINHAENFEAARGLRTLRRSPVDGVGLNYRMHELVAVLARHGLKELEERNERRRELANELPHAFVHYKDCDRGHSYFSAFVGPGVGGEKPSIVRWKGFGPENACYVVPLSLDYCVDRPRFIRRCAKRGLPVQSSYTTPLHHLRAFRKYATRPLPVVDELHEKTLCLLTTLTPDKPISYARKVAGIVREALE